MTFSPLGDQAVLARFHTEAEAWHFAKDVGDNPIAGVVDIVPAYRTVAIFYDLNRTRYATLVTQLQARPCRPLKNDETLGRSWVIPCCYELGPDLSRVALHTGLSTSEVVHWHSATEYTVYAIGFCPGFPYLGYLPERLCNVPRLPSPRLRVEPGSVGLTGRQTGVYPLVRPGGWNLVGLTPLVLVDVAAGYFPLRTGDRVRFVAIDRAEFARRHGERLDQISAAR